MSLGINSVNPFQKAYGANLFAGGSVAASQSTCIFSQNQNNTNQSSVSPLDRDTSIFNKFTVEATGLNPFASVNNVKSPVQGVVPVNARENYRNGLAPSSDLQNVFAGQYNGKANILNQIAIA